MKRLKLFIVSLALLGGGTFANAQTNLIAGWDGGTNTGSPANFGWSKTESSTFGNRNGSGCRMTDSYSGYKLEGGASYTYSSTSDPSSMIFWVRYNNGGNFTYTFQGLEPNHYYDFSGLLGWHNNSNAPTFTVKINDGTSDLATMSKYISTKQTLYAISSRFKTPSTITNTTDIKIVFTCNQTGDCMEAISALKLVNVVVKDELQAAISYATRVNTTLSNSTLASAITTAQGVYDNASATQTQVNEAVSTLNTATATALDSAAPADMSFVINNPGFESSTAISANQGTGSSQDYASTGWTALSTSTSNSCGAVVAYGSSYTLNGATAPSADNNSYSGNALGISVGWSATVAYQSSAVTLPAGSYTMTVHGYNNNSSGSNFTSKNGFITGTTSYLSTKTSFTYGAWETDVITFSLTEPTTGVFQIGGTAGNNTSTSHAKVFFDNITLTTPLKAAITAWNTAHDTLEGLDATDLPDAAEDAITTELAKTCPNTQEEIESATAALQALIDSYDEIKAAYDKALALIVFANNEKDNSTGDKTTFETAINAAANNIETRTSASDLISDYNTLEDARQAYVTSGAQPTEGNVFDYTFKIADAAVTGIGWSESGTASGEQYTGAPDNKYFDCGWNSTLNKNQTVESLPAGYYTLKAATRAKSSEVTEANIYVNQEREEFNQSTNNHRDGNTGGELGNGWGWSEVNFELRAIGKVTVGFYAQTTGQGWAGADDFHLYYKAPFVGATTEEKNALAQAITTAESKTLGFENGEYAPYNNSSALEALAAAKVLDVETANSEEVNTAKDALANATWTANNGDVDAIYNGNFAIANGTNPKGWTRSNNGWGQQINNLTAEANGVAEGTTTAWYYNSNGAWQYGNDGVYTMPLAASQAYVLSFKYRKHGNDGQNWMKASVLNSANEGLEVIQFPGASSNTTFQSVKAYFTTGAAGNYILSIEQNGNAHLTDVSLVKAQSTEYALSEDATAAPTEMAYYETVALTRTLSASYWNTFSVPFDMAIPDEWTVKEFDSATDNVINFKDAESIVAGNPYLVKPASDVTEPMVFNGVTVSSEAVTKGEGNYKFAAQLFHDTSLPTDGTIAYLATDGTIKKLTSGGIKGLRAYFIIPAGSNPDNARIAFTDGDQTGIKDSFVEATNDNRVYDLQGRQVKAMKKGIYVVNGKKVIK